MKRIFISQPMKDKTDEQILKERERAVSAVKEKFNGEDVEVIDSFFSLRRMTQNHCGFLGNH